MTTVLGLIYDDDTRTAELLAPALADRGARLLCLPTEAFPTEVKLHAELGPDGYRGWVATPDGRIDLASIDAIWTKRVAVGVDIPREGMDPTVRMACRAESEATLEGVLAALPVRWVNPLTTVLSAERKPWQLARAMAAGLTVPATVLTNVGSAAVDFYGDHRPLITKMMSTRPVRASSGRKQQLGTHAIHDDDLPALAEGLRFTTTTLQHRVAKRLEVRASVVGDRIFASAVDSPSMPGAEVDWRERSGTLMDRFEPIDMPADVAHKLVALHRDLGLVYGGADFIITPDDEWVFLETNPCGEWDWIHRSGHDVAGALADALVGRA